MNVLVTGGAGYVGSVVFRNLIALGHKVVVFDDLLFGGESLIDYLSHPKFSFIKGDVRKKQDVKKALEGVDSVVHLAAIVGEHACKPRPKVATQTNYDAACLIADLAKEQNIKKFIFISTCSNYGINKDNTLATEDSPLHPISLYAETKVNAEKYILHLNSRNFHPTILRLATVYGISPRMRFDLLISELVHDAFAHKKLTVYKPNAWRPLIHVEDVARAISLVVNAPLNKVGGNVFNVGYGNYRKIDLVNSIKKVIKKVEIIIEKDKGDLRDYKVTFDKIKKILNFSPNRSIEQGIEETYLSLKNGIFKNPGDLRFKNN